MKGLLIKDLQLMKNQKQFFLVAGAVGLVFLIGNYHSAFVVSYLMFMFSTFTVSTIAYDEYDNGAEFLFTLPVSRKQYVREKYLFCVILTGVCWLACVGIELLNMIVRHSEADMQEFLVTSVIFLAIALFMQELMIPVQLKYGSEKRKIVMTGIFVLFFLLFYTGVKLVKKFNISEIKTLINFISSNVAGLITAGIVICIVTFVVSYCISARIMQNKEL